ncbi:MAG: hypothetical protein JWM11_3805 [Planctomycetaceae bacterium]|nr:hypothetical protein [Planctomycetaceae bacterium]
MCLLPVFLDLTKLLQFALRQRICESEGDKIGCAILSPMRQMANVSAERQIGTKPLKSRRQGQVEKVGAHRVVHKNVKT